MHWGFILIAGLVVAATLALKRVGLVSAETARAYLKQGALVVDVRSTEEFKAGHLSSAINMPLNELQTSAIRRVPDQDQVLLLHCLSGTRSGLAKRRLKGMGYNNVFNLGSLTRARKIAGTSSGVA
ncbi:MAG: rhodanese-like domain-containing protein [Verrucomicrobiia bacterium]